MSNEQTEYLTSSEIIDRLREQVAVLHAALDARDDRIKEQTDMLLDALALLRSDRLHDERMSKRIDELHARANTVLPTLFETLAQLRAIPLDECGETVGSIEGDMDARAGMPAAASMSSDLDSQAASSPSEIRAGRYGPTGMCRCRAITDPQSNYSGPHHMKDCELYARIGLFQTATPSDNRDSQ